MGLDGAGGGRAIEERWKAMHEWQKEPSDVAELVLFVARLPKTGPTGQVFSLAGRLL
jgi:hypothetical protein